MARGKSNKLAPFQKLITIMISGKPVTLEEMDTLLGDEIYMYRISTYMWHIKTLAGGTVKTIKDGRKVAAYQIMNVKDVKAYMDEVGITASGFKPGSTTKKPSVAKLADLKATPLPKVKVTKPAKVKQVKPVVVAESVVEAVDEIEVTEVTV
jgi:hypothetical protein